MGWMMKRGGDDDGQASNIFATNRYLEVLMICTNEVLQVSQGDIESCSLIPPGEKTESWHASINTNNADGHLHTGWRRQSKSLPCLGFVVPSPCNYIIARQHEHGLAVATLQGRQPANESLGLSSVKVKLKEGGEGFCFGCPSGLGWPFSWAGPLAFAAMGPDNLFCCHSMHLGAKEGGWMRAGRQPSHTEYDPGRRLFDLGVFTG